jgi:hypothetical protein
MQQYPQEEDQQVSYHHRNPHAQHRQHSPVPSPRCLLPAPAAAAPPLGVPPEMPNVEPWPHPTPRYKHIPRKKSSRLVTTTTPNAQHIQHIQHIQHSPHPQPQCLPPSQAATAPPLDVPSELPNAKPCTQPTPRYTNNPTKKSSRSVTNTVPHIHTGTARTALTSFLAAVSAPFSSSSRTTSGNP